MNRDLISGRQLTLLVFTFILATATLFLPVFATMHSDQDGWLSPIIAGVVGILVVLIVTYVALKHPEVTLIEYSQILLGKWFGKLIGLIFIIFNIHITSIMVREVAVTVQSNLLPLSSLELITIILFFSTAFTVKHGLEVITRTNVINLVLTFLAMFTCLVLLLKDVNLELLTPVYTKGIVPILKDSVPQIGWFSEVVSIAFLVPFLNKPKEVRICSIIGIVWAFVTLSIFVALAISLFGPKLTSLLTFPTLEAVRLININDYFQRAEIIFLIPWIISNIIKICFFYYLTVLIISRWFKIQNMNDIVLPVGLFIFSLSIYLFKNSFYLTEFLSGPFGYYAIMVQIGLPLILLIAQLFYNRRSGRFV